MLWNRDSRNVKAGKISDGSPDEFCVVAVPGCYQSWSWGLPRVNKVVVHLGGKEKQGSSVGHAVYRLQGEGEGKVTASCPGTFCVGAVTGGFQVWSYACGDLESVIVHLVGWASPLFLKLFSEVSHQHWDYMPSFPPLYSHSGAQL